jgi:lactate permease
MFQQVLDPIFGSLALSAVFAALPLVLLFVLLGVFRVKASYSALAALGLSLALAIIGWGMPVTQALSATAAGVVYGLFPIIWILANALWIYKLTVATPWFATFGRTIRSISNDLRILSILIAFCFGALLESLAGFGAPVAISAAMLIAAGMKPLKSAIVSLLANTAPVAFGAMAAPIFALAGVTGLPVQDLASMAGRQTPFIAMFVPLLLVILVDGTRGLKQTWPVAVVAGITFAAAQFVTANYFAVELTDVVASVLTMVAVLVMLKFWQPAEIIGMHDHDDVEGAGEPVPHSHTHDKLEADATTPATAAATGGASTPTAPTAPTAPPALAAQALATADLSDTTRPAPAKILMAVAPYLVIMTIFSIAQIPAIKEWLAMNGTVTFRWPGLDVVNPSGGPVASEEFHLDHLKAPGTLLFISGLITMALYKIPLRTSFAIYWATLKQLRWTIVTVTAVLGLSFVMNLSGQTNSLGVALASAGGFFVLLSPVIGWIGVALTGSDTSSNSLFGLLQVTAANEVGLPAVLMAAANSSAGVLGKMLSLQNLAVAAAAVGLEGSENTLFRRLLPWSVGMLVFITILIALQSTVVLGWMVP